MNYTNNLIDELNARANASREFAAEMAAARAERNRFAVERLKATGVLLGNDAVFGNQEPTEIGRDDHGGFIANLADIASGKVRVK